MSTPHGIEELLSPMTQADDDLAPRRVQVDRDKIIERMVEASLAPPTLAERFSARKVGYAVAMAAGFAVAAFGGAHWWSSRGADDIDVVALRGQVTSVRGGVVTVLGIGEHAKLEADAKLETAPGASAELKAPAGVVLNLAENTQIALSELATLRASTLRLDRGEVRCIIEHQPARVFSVVTPDARVVDIGTVFTVHVKPAAAPASSETRVSVEQGEVLIKGARGEEHLRANQSWSSAPPPAVVAAAPAAPELAPASPELVLDDSAEAPRPGSKPTKSRANTLAAETELLKSGLASEQRGDYRAAAQSLGKLVKRYPGSPLAPDAKAALSRVKGHLQSQK